MSRPPKPDASPDPEPIDRPSRYLASNRNVDLLFLVDDSSSMRLSQDNLRRNFPRADAALEEPARRPAQRSHRASSRRTWARATARSPSCDCDAAARTESSSTRARGDVHATGPAAGRDVHLGHRRRRELHRQPRRTCSPASPRSARRAAASSTSSRRSRARSASTASAPRPPRTRASCAPTRYLAIVMITNEDDCSARRPGVPHRSTPPRTTTWRRSSGRRRTSAATSSVTSATARCPEPPRAQQRRERDRSATTSCTSNDTEGYLLSRRGHREPDPGAQGRRRPGPGRRDHRPARAVRRELEGADDRRHVVRRGVLPVAGDRALVHGADGSFADPAVRISELVDQFGAQRPACCRSATTSFAPALADIAQRRSSATSSAPCIMGRIAKQAGHDARRLHGRRQRHRHDAIPDCADTGAGRHRAGASCPARRDTCSGVTVDRSRRTRDGAPQDTTVDCPLCAAGVSDAGARLPLSRVAAPQPHCAGGQLCWRRWRQLPVIPGRFVGPPVA